MRHILSTLLIPAVILTVESAPAQADNRNAATWYERAATRLYDAGGNFIVADEEWNLIDLYRSDPTRAPTPELRAVVARFNRAMEDVRRGSTEGYADFDLDYSQGFNLLLPHITPMRIVAKVLQADAMIRLHDGDLDGASDRIATMYRMSRHGGDDQVIISSLVGRLIWNMADQTAQVAFDRGEFTAAQSAELLNALRDFDQVDPFQMIESVAMEQAISGDWLAADLASQEARAKYLEGEGWLTGNAEKDQQLASMSEEEFLAEIDEYDRAMHRIVEAFMMEDREAGAALLKEIEREVRDGEHGVLTSVILPALGRVHELMGMSEQLLAERIDMLEALTEGSIEPKQGVNAAMLYLQGIRELRRIEIDRVDQVITYAGGGVQELDETLQKTLADCGPVIDAFREGSTKSRCDFAPLRPGWRIWLCYDYNAGMRDALRVIRAEVRRRLSAGELDSGVDLLAVCYRVLGHMSGDEPLINALIAHEAFEQTGLLAKPILNGDDLSPEHCELMLTAVESIPRKDPFAFVNATVKARESITRPLRGRAFESEEDRNRTLQLIDYLNHQPADRILYLFAVEDTITRAELAKPENEWLRKEWLGPDPLTRLGGLIDYEALLQVRDEAEQAKEMIRQGKHREVLGREGLPVIVRVSDQSGAARRELRELLLRLRSIRQAQSEDAAPDASRPSQPAPQPDTE
ncbi:MAG: hypothetical protein JSV91_01900 [Phycisphaerales bacterium]|nr:MAG: hypothetical protein JSV91_01900 [Phycisphaerales bacterium]